jgi:hypothetical protein
LKDQALRTIEQARRVAHNPNAIDEHTIPEAIALAGAMRSSRELARDIGQIHGLESMLRRLSKSRHTIVPHLAERHDLTQAEDGESNVWRTSSVQRAMHAAC